MRINGNKSRIADDIIEIVTKNLTDERWYIEPFMGGCNVFGRVEHGLKLGGDSNECLVSLFRELQENGADNVKDLYPLIDKPLYDAMRREYRECKCMPRPLWMYPVVLMCCSYKSRWLGGFTGKHVRPDGRTEDHVKEAINGIVKDYAKFKCLKDSVFMHGSYDSLPYGKMPNSVIYCDPPYKGTIGYIGEFDHERFWDWCRSMARDGHELYISEYQAPSDFKCIREWVVQNTNSRKDRVTERLFVPIV